MGLTLALFATTALSAEWRIVEVSGVVRVAEPGRDAAAGRLNAILPVGSSVTTAAGGRASLDNGLQRIVVGPNSRMTIAPETTSGMTRIAQDLGAILFQVDKKKAPHFRVDTPLLAAVVKGTTFTVVVDVQSDTVNVAEGLVEVRSNAGSMSQDVPRGATASVLRDAPQAVQMSAIAASAPDTAPAVIEPLDYGAVSGGLVEVGGLPNGAAPLKQAASMASGGQEGQGALGAPSAQTASLGPTSTVASLVAARSNNTALLPTQAGGVALGVGNGGGVNVGGPGTGPPAEGASPGTGGGTPATGDVGLALGNSGGGTSNPGSGNPGGGASTAAGGGLAGGVPGGGTTGLGGVSATGGVGLTGSGPAGGTGGVSVDLGVGLGTGASGTGTGGPNGGLGLGNGNSGGGTGTGGLTGDLGLGNGNSGSGTTSGGGTVVGVTAGPVTVDLGVNATDTSGLLGGPRVRK